MFYRIERKAGTVNISRRNIEWATRALTNRNIDVVARDVGGHCHRTLFMDVGSGDVWVKQGDVK